MTINFFALAVALARNESRQYSTPEVAQKAVALYRLAQPICGLRRPDPVAERAGQREWAAMI